MKQAVIFFIILLISAVGCRKKTVIEAEIVNENLPAPYDTTAIDSFSVGASPDFLRKQSDSLNALLDSARKKKEDALKPKEDPAALKKDSEKKKSADAAKKVPAKDPGVRNEDPAQTTPQEPLPQR